MSSCTVPVMLVRFKLNLKLRSALFWDITRRHVVIVYRRFGTTYLSHLHGFFLLGLLTREDGKATLSRNVGKQLPHEAAQYRRRAQISSTSRRKPQIELRQQIFEKSSNMKFHENPSSGSRVLFRWTDGQTDRHDEANSLFSQLCEHV
jgi:hypothetical protein